MEEFKRNGKKIQENTVEQIQEEYGHLLRQYKNIFIEIIINIIYEEQKAFPCSIPDYKIEEWVEDYLITELRARSKREFNKTLDILMEIFEHTAKNLEIHSSKNNVLGEYETNLDEIKSSNRTNWIEDIIEEFIYEFTKRVEFYFSAFIEISSNNFYDNLQELRSSIKYQLLRRSETFCDEYKDIINRSLKTNINQIEQKLENVTLPKESELHLEGYLEIMELNNFELIKENGINYALDKSSRQKYELEINKNILILKNSKICFLIDDKKSLYFNQQEQKAVCYNGLDINVTDHLGNNGYKIEMGFCDYTFYEGKEKCTEPAKIAEIINRIKKDVPNYYDKISTNQYFQTIEETLINLGYITKEEEVKNNPKKK